MFIWAIVCVMGVFYFLGREDFVSRVLVVLGYSLGLVYGSYWVSGCEGRVG